MKKLCLILNMLPHYRKAIYLALDNEFDCDWYAGSSIDNILCMDYSQIKRLTTLNTVSLGNKFYFQIGILKLLFDTKYSSYLLTGDIRNISLWLFLLLNKLFARKKVYTWTHGNNGKGGKLSNWIKFIFASLPDGIFLYGTYAKDYMISQGIASHKLFVINNSLDYAQHINQLSYIKQSDIYKQHFSNNKYNIIFIGRLTKVKRLDLLIEAVYKLNQKGTRYNVTFIGDGEERVALENMVHSYGMDNLFWFYGSCYDEQQNAELIYNADICVSPGNVGLTAIHSLTFGTPVITHNNYLLQMPEFESIIEGKTGSFFNYSNSDSLANSIENWFAKFGDRRQEIRNNCMKEIESCWTPQYQINVFKQNIDLFHEAIAN